MSSYSLKGSIHAINPTEKVSDRFSKREFAVRVAENPEYPQLIKLQFTQDKCNILNGYKIGQDVEVWFNLNGREVNGQRGKQIYNSLDAWKIVSLQDEHHAAQKDSDDQLTSTGDLPF